MLNEKDKAKLIKLPNDKLAMYHARVYIKDATRGVIQFFKDNKDKINGEVAIVETKDDASIAASLRNSGKKVLFVFSDEYNHGIVPSYFSGTSERIPLPMSLLIRGEVN